MRKSRNHGVEVEPDEIRDLLLSTYWPGILFHPWMNFESARAAHHSDFPTHSAANRNEKTWMIGSHTMHDACRQEEIRLLWRGWIAHAHGVLCTHTRWNPMTRDSSHHRTSQPEAEETETEFAPTKLAIDRRDIWRSKRINPLWFKTAQNRDIKPHTIPWAQERASEQVSKEVSAVERTSNASNVGRT